MTAIAQGVAALFNPARLFSSGEQGVWYDPSDMTTLFQDAAGTTPVTAVEQPVGLVLDKSKGLVLGPELVTNGDFSNGTTGWSGSNGGEIAVVSGELELTNSLASYGRADQAISLTIGRTYKVTGKIRSGTAGNTAGVYVDAVAYVTTSSLSSVNFEFVFVATATSKLIRALNTRSTIGYKLYIDNISVRELPGNHATQTTAASRPVLSARYNLLVDTERFDTTSWNKNSGGVASVPVVTPNAAIAPDGTLSADQVVFNINGGTTTADISNLSFSTLAVTGGVSYTQSIYLKTSDGSSKVFTFVSVDGVVRSITVTGSWQRFELTTTPSASITNNPLRLRLRGGEGTASSASILVWGAQLTVTNSLPSNAYQRVNTATDYDTVGFKTYLSFDGVDDFLVTPSINFTSTDKMTVCAGVRKLSDAVRGMAVEFGDGSLMTNQWGLNAPVSNTPSYAFRSSGTSAGFADVTTGYPAPTTNVLTGIGDISGDSAILRVNGTQAASSTADQGTGTYGNYPLYIGRRAGTSGPFKGHIYSLIVRGAQSSDAQIRGTEAFVNSKTGAY